MPTYTVERTHRASTNTSVDEQGFISTTETIEYTVVSDTPGVTATQARRDLQATGQLPREGEVHPASGLAAVTGVDVRSTSPIFFEATATYSSAPRPQSDNDEDEDGLPWQLPASLKFSSVTTNVPTDHDANNKPIVNPVTNELVTGITRPVTDFGVSITKNILGLNPVAIRNFANRVNSDTFLGFAPGLCKTGDISAEPANHNGQVYYVVTVPIVVRDEYASTPDKAWWNRRVLKGFYEVRTLPAPYSRKYLARSRDGEGQYETSPVMLKANGERLIPPNTPPTATPTPPVYEERQVVRTASFSAMGIL